MTGQEKILDFIKEDFIKEDFIGENEEKKKIDIIEWAKQMGKSLKDFVLGKREKIGKDIEKQAAKDLKKFKEQSFQRQELEKLKDCYEIEQKDSIESFANIIAIASLFIAAVTGIDSLFDSIDTSMCIMAIKNIIVILFIAVMILMCGRILLNVGKDNVKFRNHMIAINLALLEMESDNTNSTNDENLPKDNEEAVAGEKNN